MLKDVDLNKLRAFYWVCRRRRLLVAAKDLFVTASAVSQAIRGLERELETTLFVRSGKQYLPTRAALQLLTTIEPFFKGMTELRESFRSDTDALRGTIHCGAPAEYGATRLVALIHTFQEQHPAVQVAVTLLDTQRLVPALLENRLDLVVCDQLVPGELSPLVDLKPLRDETLVLACSRAYSATEIRGDYSLRHLKTLTFIPYVARHEAVHKWFLHHFDQYPPLRWSIMIDSAHGVREAVHKGMGLGVLPLAMIQDEVARGDLVVVTTPRTALINRMVVMQLRDFVSSAAQHHLVQHLLRAETGASAC